MEETRYCPRCELPKPIDLFSKTKSGKFKFCCSPCLKEYKKERYRKNPTKALESAKKWAEDNREKYKENQDRYREENREKLRLDAIEYRKINKIVIQEKDKIRNQTPERKNYHINNINKRMSNDPIYRRYRLDQVKGYVRNWQRANPMYMTLASHKRRVRLYKNGGSTTQEEIKNLYIKQQGKCEYCLVELNNKYDIDHLIPISKGGANSIFNLRLSCRSCNQSKGNKLIYREWIPPRYRNEKMKRGSHF